MDLEKLRAQLEPGLVELGFVSENQLSELQKQQLLDYLALFAKWNKVYNLSAIRDPEEMLVKHVFDSLAVVPHLQADHLIDVGTGGGLPGIPIAITTSGCKVDLLDSNQKKTRFLVQVKAQLGLDNVTVVADRVENHQQQYDAVISRAFTAMDNFVEITRHLLSEGGKWWAMKSQNLPAEIASLPADVELIETIDLQVPDLDAERYLAVLQAK